jgi:hypothetical protein
MIARGAAIASLVVVGIIIADVLIHPTGTAAASSGVQGIEKPAINGLLGATS